MKEAAGEANMTVITIVLIGVVAAVGAILVPRILDSANMKSACAEMGGNLSGKKCTWKDYTTNPDGEEKYCTLTKCNKGANKDKWVCVRGCV